MTSQRPLRYMDAFFEFAERGTDRQALPLRWRTNTDVILEVNEDDEVMFDVILYGNRIARLFNDGSVQVWDVRRRSNTTRNRLNDVLHPIGWHIRMTSEGWTLFPHGEASRNSALVRYSKRFVSGMTLDPIGTTRNNNSVN